MTGSRVHEPSRGAVLRERGVLLRIGLVLLLVVLATGLATHPVAADSEQPDTASQRQPDDTGDDADDPADADAPVMSEPQLEVALSDDTEGPVPSGATFTYTVEVANAGPADLTEVSMADRLPAGVSVTGVRAPGPWTCVLPSGEGSNDSLYCTLEALPAGDRAPPLTVEVRVAEDASGDVEYRVEADSAESEAVEASETTAVAQQQAALTVDVTDDVESTVPFGGGQFAYTVTVANPGPVELTDVSVSDQLPASVAVTGVTAPRPWTCVLPSEGTHGGQLYCTLEALAAGERAPELTIGVQVAEDFSGDLQNTVEADSPQTDPARDVATTTVDVETRVLGNVLEKPTSAPATDATAPDTEAPAPDTEAAGAQVELAQTGPSTPHQRLAWTAALALVLGALLLWLGRPVTARR